jgi:hypothetical protein
VDAVRFGDILDAQVKRVRDVLVAKRDEYANEDVLANFKKSANLRGVTPPQAVSGMMVKHTVSIYDMVESGKTFTLDQWDEKITDHLNYLILLRATLVDNENVE